MDNTLTKKKKGFKMPHVIVVMLLLMLLVTIMTYIVPSGTYTRVENPETGVSAVDPNSYTRIESTPVGFFDYFLSIYNGFVQGATIMGSLLLSSGALAILRHTGSFDAGIQALIRKTKGKEFVVVTIFFIAFTALQVMGMGEGAYPFYPMVIAVFMSIGYDRMVGTAIMMLSTTAGFTSGIVNLFTTGISQQIVGLPLFSGIEFRVISLVVFFAICYIYIWRYCVKIKKDPTKSYVKEEYMSQQSGEAVATEEGIPFNVKRIIALSLFVASIIFRVICNLTLGWGLAEAVAIYMIYAVILVILFRLNVNEACNVFVKGAGNVLGASLVIGLSRSVMVLLTQGNILDTFVNGMANMLGGKSAMITLLIIFIFVSLFNFLIGSGSGKAVMVMPILNPLGQLLNINQQVLVLAYQFGDGITNSFWPSGAMVGLSLSGVEYGSWIKFSWKVFALISLAAYGLIIIADFINLGPF